MHIKLVKLSGPADCLILISSPLLGKLNIFTTDAMYSDIQRRIAKLGEYFQATMRIVSTCLSPELRKYQNAITVEQVSMRSIFITYFKNATSY